jgi:hypothetical protein
MGIDTKKLVVGQEVCMRSGCYTMTGWGNQGYAVRRGRANWGDAKRWYVEHS